MGYWEKIEEGWYQGQNGEIIQRWYRAPESPKNKAGWYLWAKEDLDNKPRGPFKTLKEAIGHIGRSIL